MFYSNGDIYNGKWNAEKKDRWGKYMYSGGSVIEGKYQNGRLSGDLTKVSLLYSDKQQVDKFAGEYVKGARSSGTYTHANGDKYLGWFESAAGAYDGQGQYTWACGKVYEGSFKNGKPHGNGVMTYKQVHPIKICLTSFLPNSC